MIPRANTGEGLLVGKRGNGECVSWETEVWWRAIARQLARFSTYDVIVLHAFIFFRCVEFSNVGGSSAIGALSLVEAIP